MIGHLIYTYDRLDDAKILQEISKKYLAKELGDIFLIHAYNGKNSFGYSKYLEDKLITTKNKGHFEGACDLINKGIIEAEKNLNIDYLIVTAADTWTLNADFIKKVILKMKDSKKVIATCAWDDRGMVEYDKNYTMNLFKIGFATDFFILDMKWQRENRLFPLNLMAVSRKFDDIKVFLTGNIVFLEDALAYSYANIFIKKYKNDYKVYKNSMINALYHITERERIHFLDNDGIWKRKMEWPDLGIYTYHDEDVQKKKRVLQSIKEISGENIEKLKNIDDLAYFNKVN
jgi:hypothetical protein